MVMLVPATHWHGSLSFVTAAEAGPAFIACRFLQPRRHLRSAATRSRTGDHICQEQEPAKLAWARAMCVCVTTGRRFLFITFYLPVQTEYCRIARQQLLAICIRASSPCITSLAWAPTTRRTLSGGR